MRFAIGALVLVLAGCGCGKGDAAQNARAPTQSQLASAFAKLQAIQPSNSIIYELPQQQFPPELAVLEPKSITFRSGVASVHLAGCVDDKVYLHFRDLDAGARSPEIVLSPSEVEDPEVLWRYPKRLPNNSFKPKPLRGSA